MDEGTEMLLWLIIWVTTVTVAAVTTGFVLVATAFVRESRKRAAADWARAMSEWGRVRNEQEELGRERAAAKREAVDAARRDWYRAGREPQGLQNLMRDYGAGFMTEAEVRGAMPASWLAGKTITTECVEPDCVYVDIPHTDADHAFCEDDDCTKFASQHTIADHVAKTPQDLDNELCTDPGCPAVSELHSIADHVMLDGVVIGLKNPKDPDYQLAAEKYQNSNHRITFHPHTLGDHSALRPEEGT